MNIELIEDDPLMGEALAERLEIEGMRSRLWRSASELLRATERGLAPGDGVISDVRLPDLDGPELHARLPAEWRALPWIFITGYGTSAQRDALLARGAVDFFTKPLDMDRLMQRLRSLQPKRPSAPAGPQPAADALDCPLGVSSEMRKLYRLLTRLGQQWSTVLITGESGAGKEVVARCLHRESLPEGAPFVAVNATSLPESLIEAELFGYDKGAFSGALRSHRGLFEQASGGTLFLDEIGDMPLTLQARLLRVLEDRSVTRIGSEKPIRVDVRLIFATHRNLNEEVRAGRFREDLYYRINVVHLPVPPLRERPEDVPWLAQRFIDAWNAANPGARRRLDLEGERILLAQRWPGNVRELRNCVERACLLSETETLDARLLRSDASFAPSAVESERTTPQADTGGAPGVASEAASTSSALEGSSLSLESYLRQQERDFVLRALEHHSWQMSQTAAALGISRKNLWERMKRLGIQ
ncbi:MAG: sigma-54-dependent transcriptional regulator [Casimicrobiaceae bacterium]